MTRFETMSRELQPMLLTVPDGRIVLVSRAAAEKKRAVAH